MRIFKSNPLLKLVNSYLVDSAQPSNISYAWNFGSLLAFCLIIQIVTGVTLAMHYNPNVLEAFNSVEHIMRDVNNGWLLRYLHSNTASAFFFLVYLHIGRGLYYGSYKAPRTLVWTIGGIIFILMMATAFLGYVLPYGQMSLWGATVITNLMSAIPWIGQDIVEFIWGGFSVNNATLNRFFALHFVLPFILAALALMHLITLHDRAGSGNPLGISGNSDRLPFAPYYIFKDLITIFMFILALSIFVFFMPNVLGDSENYVMANPMQTPPAIVPEWYLLPFYAILRSIPNKLLGVIAMFSAILIILTLPFTDLSRSRGIQFRPLSKIAFYIFIGNFLILMILGGKHVESPFIEFGQVSTLLYFSYFLIIVPLTSLLENSLIELVANKQNLINKTGIKNESDNFSNLKFDILASYVIWQLHIASIKHVYNLYSYIIYIKNCAAFLISREKFFTVVTSCFYLILALNVIEFQYYQYLSSDAPRPWGLYFQDSGTPQMEGLVELHDNILFYLVIILFAVGWILTSILKVHRNTGAIIPYKYKGHGTFVELVWTITPSLILILIAFPSFKLLFLMDEVSDPAMAVLAEGHQWYWSYQYPDFINNDEEFIEFDSYLVPESDLESGALRMLEVDNRLIIPELTHVRFIVTAADVIHSFACPSLGIKCDAYPGRLNQVSVMLNREGTFFGQCSEICGILHSSMPIVMESISVDKFVSWLTLSLLPFNIVKYNFSCLHVSRYIRLILPIFIKHGKVLSVFIATILIFEHLVYINFEVKWFISLFFLDTYGLLKVFLLLTVRSYIYSLISNNIHKLLIPKLNYYLEKSLMINYLYYYWLGNFLKSLLSFVEAYPKASNITINLYLCVLLLAMFSFPTLCLFITFNLTILMIIHFTYIDTKLKRKYPLLHLCLVLCLILISVWIFFYLLYICFNLVFYPYILKMESGKKSPSNDSSNNKKPGGPSPGGGPEENIICSTKSKDKDKGKDKDKDNQIFGDDDSDLEFTGSSRITGYNFNGKSYPTKLIRDDVEREFHTNQDRINRQGVIERARRAEAAEMKRIAQEEKNKKK